MAEEVRHIVKVQYYSETTQEASGREYTYYSIEASGREYTYYSIDSLKVGDMVIVPVRDTTSKAKVSSIDVPEAEIQAFKDKVKIIPAGSVVMSTLKTGREIAEKMPTINDPVITEALHNREIESGEVHKEELIIGEGTALVRIKPDTDSVYLALREQAHGLLIFAESRTVATDHDVKPATDDLSIISKLKKAIEEKRKEYLTPLNEYVKSVNSAFKFLTEPLEQADKITRGKILNYRQEQERIRREAEDINRAKEELARREAALNQGVITVDTTPVAVPDAPSTHVRTDMGNLGTTKTWRFEIADFSLLPEEYKIPDLVKIGKVVRADVAIPGVKAWQEESLRITTR